MASVGEAQDRLTRADGESCEPEVVARFGQADLRALMDVVFGGAALVLLLTWIVLAIVGGQAT